MRWQEVVRHSATVADVAVALGLDVRSVGTVRGFTCPLHGADHSDGRPSGRIVHDGHGWRCWACDVGGDAISLACIVLTGAARPDGSGWRSVRAWFAGHGWCPASGDGTSAPTDRYRAAPPKPVELPSPKRQDAREVAALWSASTSVVSHGRSRRWLMARGIDYTGVAALDLARGIGRDVEHPAWAGFGEGARFRGWGPSGWSLALPCWDSDGRLAGIRARYTGTVDSLDTDGTGAPYSAPDCLADPERMETYLSVPDESGAGFGGATGWVEKPAPYAGKEVSPHGGGVRAMVYACPVGRWLLGGMSGPIDPTAPDLRWNGQVLVVEGGPAYLRYASEPGRVTVDDGLGWTYAVLGVWSGAWADDVFGRRIAERLWRADSVALGCDADDAGRRMQDAIARTLDSVRVKHFQMVE